MARSATAVNPVRLTRRQQEISVLVAQGLTNREIGRRLFISERTADGHLEQIRNKLGVSSRAQIASWATQQPFMSESSGSEDLRGRSGGTEPPNNLPAQLSSFVGRDSELTAIGEVMARSRLVTLTGVGGCGKTRLALQIASRVSRRFADGVWLVDLAPISDPALVADAAAAVLGLRDGAGRAPDQLLIGHLRERRLLLLLDNCEHLVGTVASMVDLLLRSCPELSVLATSRESLGVSGEVTWPVPSLAVPDMLQLPPAQGLREIESVRLFAERAVDRVRSFTIDDTNALPVAHICAQLEGLPLAIELAAARVRVLTVDQILQRLDDRFGLLSGGMKTLPERHQTLMAAIAWSHDLLTPEERALFRRLSVFAGTFDLATVEAVCPGEDVPSDRVLDILTQLADKSLVIADGGRYRLLDTIREFGIRCLSRADEADPLHRRLAQHLRRRIESKGAMSLGDWLELISKDHVNLRSALEWCEQTDVELGLELLVVSYGYWHSRGYVAEARHQLQRMLARQSEPSPWLARSCLLLAGYAYLQGDFETTDSNLVRCRELARAAADRPVLAEALGLSGILALGRGEVGSAIASFNEEFGLWRELRDRQHEATSLYHLGEAVALDGDMAEARALFERSLAVLDELGLRSEGLMTLSMLAGALVLQGESAQARRVLRECLEIGRAHGDRRLANCLEVAAGLAVAEGEPERALVLAGAGAAMHEAGGQRPADPWQRLVASVIVATRALLGEGRADAAWAGGRKLGFEEAINYCLEGVR
jgi:non-specific serine/threonine protein kinase